jgi:hypothetical protein
MVVRGTAGVHPAVARCLERLDGSGARWCLLRGGRDLDSLAGDVDLLVDRRDLRPVRELLARAGFAELRAWGHRPHRFFVANVPGEAGRLKLDVVTELAFGPHAELRTAAAGAVLARRVRRGRLVHPSAADAFWALLLHLLLDGGRARAGRATELALLAGSGRLDSPLRTLVDRACPPGWDAERVVSAAADGRLAELSELAPELRARWPGSPRLLTAVRARLRGGLRRAGRRLPHRQHSGRMAANSAARSTG